MERSQNSQVWFRKARKRFCFCATPKQSLPRFTSRNLGHVWLSYRKLAGTDCSTLVATCSNHTPKRSERCSLNSSKPCWPTCIPANFTIFRHHHGPLSHPRGNVCLIHHPVAISKWAGSKPRTSVSSSFMKLCKSNTSTRPATQHIYPAHHHDVRYCSVLPQHALSNR